MTSILNVFPGRNRPSRITMYQDGQPISFSGVSRMLVTFRESIIEADTDVDSTLINWSTGNGVIIFNFGSLGLAEGSYTATLIAFDPAHPDGQPLIYPDSGGESGNLQFNVLGSPNVILYVQNDAGTVVNANTYNSAEDFITYHKSRGRSTAFDIEIIEQSLVKACEYLDNRFHYKGTKLTGRSQATQWPRDSAQDKDSENVTGIPIEVKRAHLEYAYYAIEKELIPNVTYDDTGYAVRSKRERVGLIEESTTYAVGAANKQVIIRPYPRAEIILNGLTRATNNKVIRG